MNTQTLIDNIKNDSILNNLASFFNNEIYLVGGCVRDFLMGKISYDRDLIVTDQDARTFALKVCEFFDGTFVPLDEENKIYRVVLKNKNDYLDITNPIGGSLDHDIMRRDLTINAIAINIKTGHIPKICIPFIKDLQDKKLKEVREENYTDDPLRLLRIFRFYSITGFEPENTLFEIAKKYSSLINKPAKERIQYEIIKLFDGEFCDKALLKMDECGILEIIFPFVKELKQVPPNQHHHLNLFYHSIETVKQLELIYKNSQQDVQNHMKKVDFGGFSRLAHLKLACFMHDIGKYSTWTIEKDTKRHRFIKHEDTGAKMCVPILKKLCFSNKQIEYISYIIKKHMYPSAVVSSSELSEKIMLRYVRHSNDKAIDNILIAKADRLSALGTDITEQMVNDNISKLNILLNFYLDIKDKLKPLPKLLDGNEIMQILNIKPSPKLGEILTKLNEAQICGEISTKEEAIHFVKSLV